MPKAAPYRYLQHLRQMALHFEYRRHERRKLKMHRRHRLAIVPRSLAMTDDVIDVLQTAQHSIDVNIRYFNIQASKLQSSRPGKMERKDHSNTCRSNVQSISMRHLVKRGRTAATHNASTPRPSHAHAAAAGSRHSS